jgi:hypothetical protein
MSNPNRVWVVEYRLYKKWHIWTNYLDGSTVQAFYIKKDAKSFINNLLGDPELDWRKENLRVHPYYAKEEKSC